MKEENLVASLHPLERSVLPVLKDNIDVQQIVNSSGLQEVEVMRALQWLENKGALKIHVKEGEYAELDENGKEYAEKGLPEKKVLQVLDKPLSIQEIKEKAHLNDDEVAVSLGLLKKLNAIQIKGKVERTQQGNILLQKGLPAEKILTVLPASISSLSKEEQQICSDLRKRKKVILVETKKARSITLTDLGKRLVKMDMSEEVIGQITPAILKEQIWKKKKMRRYDVSINVPRIYPAKRHIVNQAIQHIRKIWMDMGFNEMSGPLLETSFWNFDALFVPQDHPAREMQDTFYIKGRGNLPEKNLVVQVKKAHESGISGSTGWGYAWSQEKAKELVLRTHTTSLSARTLAQLKKENIPAKYFAIGRVFRNETLDWSHLFEFEQTEGIVIDPDVNFRHLLGYLKEFFHKMGFEKVRFRPGFFPYVEPGLECEVFHPVKKKWIELGGAGIFRPEVVKPLLGTEVPVLAWGLGLGRIIMDYWEIKDLRDLCRNDLEQLKTFKYHRSEYAHHNA